MKNVIIGILALLIIGGGAYFILKLSAPTTTNAPTPTATGTPTSTTVTPVATSTPTATSTVSGHGETRSVIGKSAGGNDIVAYHFGNGMKNVLIVGGIHGGYDWNTSLFSYDLIDYLQQNPAAVPASLSVTIIPTMNPDGQSKVIGTPGQFTLAAAPAATIDTTDGRVNAHGVDLNRNFDCNWQAQGVWNGPTKTVSGGTAPFSEPEAAAVRDYINAQKPAAVIVYYASAGAVYSSSCNGGVLPLTASLNKIYADASGYTSYKTFDAYPVTGDMTDWLAKIGIPAISVLFTDHADPELMKNQAGTLAVFKYLANN